jgi:exonuclease SbcD
VRILHTADWHLGQSLHGTDRGPEHDHFLSWLLDRLEDQRPDAFVLAGDVFDVASPHPAALARYYRFLAEGRRRAPDTTFVVVGGNHDSPQRLNAPRDLLSAMNIRVVGGLSRSASAEPDLESMLVPVGHPSHPVGWVLALPFLRPRDVFPFASDIDDPDHRLVEGHRALIQALLDRLAPRLSDRTPVAATGHCYMVGGATSDASERRIQRGYQSALPVDIYPDRIGYVALGHLHRAQSVQGSEHVRYAGSPLPLSMTERTYVHQVVLAELTDRARIDVLPVPRSVQFEVVPEHPLPLEEVERRLAARVDVGPALIEVRVALEGPQPRLRQRIEAALAGSRARLARIQVLRTDRPVAAPATEPAALSSFAPRDVFAQLCRRERGQPPSEELMALFDEAVARAQSEDDG